MTAMLTPARTDTSAGEPDRPLRVVMADDDRTDQLLMMMAADAAGLNAEFSFVDTGAQLIFHLTRVSWVDELPDLVLLDLHMPGLDGHRTLEELQAHPVLWQIPVVIYSSSRRPEDQLRSFERGAARYETKPDDFSELVDLVARCAERARTSPYIDVDSAGGMVALDVVTAGIIAELEDEFRLDGDLAACLDLLVDPDGLDGLDGELSA